MADKGKKWQEAQEMRDAGHEEAAAIHLIEDLIDEDDGSVFEDMEDDTPEEAEEIADEDEGEDDAPDDESESDIEEDDVDAEVDDEGDDDTPEDIELDLSKTVRRPVDGEDIEFTLEEAVGSFMQQKAITKRFQDLAEQRKAMQSEAEAKRAERQKYADGLERLESAMTAIVPEELSVEEIKAMSPEEIEAHKSARKNLEQIQAERERVQQEAQQETAELIAKKRQERNEFLQATIPGWHDTEKANEEFVELFTYASENYGYSPEDFNNTIDPNAFLMLRKAKLYDEMTEKGEKVRKKAKKSITLKPGSPAPKGSKSKKKEKAALSRHEKQGSLRSAASALEGLLD